MAGESEVSALAANTDATQLEDKVYLLSMTAGNPAIAGELNTDAAWPPFVSARLGIGAQSSGYTKENPNVAFKLDLALDDDYLGAVLESHQVDSGFPHDPTALDYQEQLADFFKNDSIQPVTLSLDLGKNSTPIPLIHSIPESTSLPTAQARRLGIIRWYRKAVMQS